MFSSDTKDRRLLEVWNQKDIPVILRRGGKGQRLRGRIPYSRDDKRWLQKKWLQNGRRLSPEWIERYRCWELPKAWFNDFVVRALERYRKLYVIQPYREQEKCSPSCLNARGHECECSCMGANHGAGNDGSWFEVSDAFAVRWGERHLACRLMIAI
jgi:hypothetical protein